MTRDELEATIWRAATYCTDEGTSGYLLGPAAVDAILTAADAYAAGTRRHTIADQPPVPLAIHYAPAGHVSSACGKIASAVARRPDLTADPASVTCLSCRGTREYAATRAGEQ